MKRKATTTDLVRRRLRKLLNKTEMPFQCVVILDNLVASGMVRDVFTEAKENHAIFVDVPGWDEQTPEIKRMIELVGKHCGPDEDDDEKPFVIVGEMWSDPGAKNKGTSEWIWYGHGGRRLAETAVSVRHEGFGEYVVSEYQNMGGYADPGSFDKREPFIVTSTAVAAYGFRHAAAVGAEWLGQHGGDEETAAELP